MKKITYEKPQIIELDCFDDTIVHGASGVLPPTPCLPTPVTTNSSAKSPLLLDSKGNPVLFKQD